MFINGIKFACNQCVKGHRSSHCKHSERPLIEIRKKGRPISQCVHCRDLRKKKQVHIKCVCSDTQKEKEIIENPIEDISPFKCGSTTPHACSSVPSGTGESVIVTLTPLQMSSLPTTRIMTCYCGDSCLCPGCFVHPDNHLKVVDLPNFPVFQQDYLFI